MTIPNSQAARLAPPARTLSRLGTGQTAISNPPARFGRAATPPLPGLPEFPRKTLS